MQPERVLKPPSRRRKFFLLGALFELLLIASCFALSESWLSVEIRNFVIITHFPVMMATEIMRFGNGPLSAAIFIVFSFTLMASFWGFLIYLGKRAGVLMMARTTPQQKSLIWSGVSMLALVLIISAIISALPQTPLSFQASPETRSVVEANNAFALDLYQQLKDQPGNLFFSPYSIATSLAMTCVGARGQTEMEMANALHLSLPPGKVPPAFKSLMVRMDQLQRWNRIVLKSANSLWCQQGSGFTAAFLKQVRENYSAEARHVDFKNANGAAAVEINRWIDEATDHKIKSIIGPGQLTSDTRLALCDAIYFKGKWLNQFKVKDTQPSPFHTTTNETVTVPMMYQHAAFKHAMTEDDSVELLELPYSGHDLSMVILLPSRVEYMPDAEPNDVHDLEQKLTAENLRSWLAKLDQASPHKTSVALPRFTTTSSFNLASELKALGMASAFGDTADFSGMDGTKNLYLSDVFHRAFIEVNEAGTEAAAVTLVLAKTKGMDDRFNVDHPFIFLIRDNGSGSILFLGRINDPTQ
jgi:serpin B